MSFSGAIASMIRFSSRCPGSGSWTRRPSIASSALIAAIGASTSSSDVSAGSSMSRASMPAAVAAFCFRPM